MYFSTKLKKNHSNQEKTKIKIHSPFTSQRKRMNAKFLFFSGIRLFNKIISAVFRRIC